MPRKEKEFKSDKVEKKEEEELELVGGQQGDDEGSLEEGNPLEDEIRRVEKLLQESDERYLRAIAEYDNYRKRTTKEKNAIYPAAVADTVLKFLPVLDNFDRSIEFDPSSKEFKQGIDLIYQNLIDVVKALGVEPIGEVGETFNPDIHNAVMHIENPELGENVVSMVVQKGYRIGDRVVRHAMVQTAN